MQANAGSWAAWAKAMPDSDFWMLCGIFIIAAAVCFYFTFRFFTRARLIEDTPTSKIRSAAQGYVELSGRQEMMQGVPIVSPLTGMQCTWYRYKVEEKETYHTSRGSRTRWRTIKSGISDEIFLLIDETGQCAIDPEGAEISCRKQLVWYGSTVIPLGPKRGSGGFLGWGMGGRYRYTEALMLPGEDLYAIGLFKTVGGSHESTAVADDVREILREWKADQATLIERFDTDGDGKIDVNEWEGARKAARAEALADRAKRASEPGINLLARPTNRRQPFLLSVLPQTALARRFRLYAAGCVSGFFVTGGVAVVMLGARTLG